MPAIHLFPFLLLLFLFLSNFPPSTPQDYSSTESTDPSYYYNLCSSSTCNNITLRYPFALPKPCHHPGATPYCPGDGFLHLKSENYSGSQRVLDGDLSASAITTTLLVAADALFGCGEISSRNFTVGQSEFFLPNNITYGTHLNCSRPPSSPDGLQPASCLRCSNDGTDRSNVCYYSPGFVSRPECENFFIYYPVGLNVSGVNDLRGYLQKGFQIQYNKGIDCRSCQGSGGRCGASPAGSFVCFCKESVHRTNCSDGVIEDLKAWFPNRGGSGSSSSKKVVVAVSASASVFAVILVIAAVSFLAFRRKRGILQDSERLSPNRATTKRRFKDLVDGISPTRYSYAQLKKFTNNFSSKLGEGGSGNIYKGAIQKKNQEILVAVKILKVSRQSEKQFMNEVSTIGRIHHNNLLRMLGYCVQGKKRALVYEYMENGSLDKYINITNYNRELDEAEGGTSNLEYRLSPKQMLSIAIETARGLLYLHEGCRSRILHCDIKPHNVLLDSSMSAKVSDFGLARMIDKDRSHVSLTLARGTPGYAAPEMWSKAYGPITDKSDVYSYGMLILEMVGGKIKYESNVVAPPRQVDLPQLAFEQVNKRKLESSRELGGSDKTLYGKNSSESDEEIVARMCLVGLWCIQHIPSDRPSIGTVIQMLEANAEVEIPPDPFPCDGENEQPYYLTSSTVYLSPASATVDSGAMEETL